MTPTSSVCAIVPVRGLRTGKRRLAAALSKVERHALCRAMLEDVLDTLAAFGRIVVVTGDAEAASLARAHRADVLLVQSRGLNASLELARGAVRTGGGFSRLLVMPSDLPAIAAADIKRHILAEPEDVIVARSVDGGTNLLCCETSADLPFAYGVDSARRHVAAAKAAGLSRRMIDLPSFALDIDHPCDLALFSRLRIASRTTDLLVQFGPGLSEARAA